MNLYIQLVDNKPINHPIMEDNFVQVFPDIDIENLPPNFAKFKRVDKPVIGIYQVYDEGVVYEWKDGVVKDIHQVRSMTEEEILTIQNQTKSDWESTGFVSWIFNEETCSFDPPITYPDDGNAYNWNEESQEWDLVN
jgi:hypothetical protein